MVPQHGQQVLLTFQYFVSKKSIVQCCLNARKTKIKDPQLRPAKRPAKRPANFVSVLLP